MASKMNNNQKRQNHWHRELKMLGYDESLPAPIPGVQAMICAIRDPRLHHFVQEQDALALADIDDDGNSAPLLLETLDLSDWIQLLVLGVKNPDKGVLRLQDAHAKLLDVLEKDDLDLRATEKITPLMEKALEHAHANSRGPLLCKPEDIKASKIDAPFALSAAEQAAVEHYREILHSSTSDIRNFVHRRPGQGNPVPMAPPRSVEHMLMFSKHRAWNLNCNSHLAPISVQMWQTWCSLTNEDIEQCRRNALEGKGAIKDPVSFHHGFPVSDFEPGRCSSADLQLRTKVELPSGDFRRQKHLQEMWNCGRPYFRCVCKQPCEGGVIWWDHAVWMIVNKLELFFGADYPTLRAKLAAFWLWIASKGKQASMAHITFMFRRDLSLEGVVEYLADQKNPLLTRYGNGAGIRQIERLIRPPSFSLKNPHSALAKRRKVGAAPARGLGSGLVNKNFKQNAVFERKPSAQEKRNIDMKATVVNPPAPERRKVDLKVKVKPVSEMKMNINRKANVKVAAAEEKKANVKPAAAEKKVNVKRPAPYDGPDSSDVQVFVNNPPRSSSQQPNLPR